MKKPKSEWTARQECLNSIAITDENGDAICEVISEGDTQPEHWKVARLIEMAPLMYTLLLQVQPEEKHVTQVFEKIIKYVDKNK